MCDSVSSTAPFLTYYAVGAPNSRISRGSCTRGIFIPTSDSKSSRNGRSQLISACFRPNEAEMNTSKSTSSVKTGRKSIPSGSAGYDFYGELGFKDKEKEQIDFVKGRDNKREEEKSNKETGRSDNAKASSGFNFIEFNDESGEESVGRLKDEDLVRTEEGSDGFGSKLGELEQRNAGPIAARRGRQLMKRSNMLAKQVISMKSALSMGFISQLWVDTVSWVVVVVEVRPNLLSGDLETFFLEDVSQVGDVVLIQDESVMENELKMVGLETLVGYNVVTPDCQSIGKVRGYTFNINSGAVESLELDSFGISIIPSSLVSTYALLVEDVVEVVSDAVVVHQAAASRIQRLTKGFWDSRKSRNSIDELGDDVDLERQPVQLDHVRSRRRSFTSRKLSPRVRETVDDWELPMDYL